MRLLATLFFAVPLLHSADPAPLWDGHESVAAYAQRAHLEPTKTLDLGNGVTMELVLIPAGQFVMGTEAPVKPSTTVEGSGLLIEFGAIAVLALILEQLLRFFPERRTAFSLRWLMLMVIAGGACVGGIARRKLAVKEAERYEDGLAVYNLVSDNEKPAHPVTISRAFYMGKFTVTQAQYEAVTGTNPSQFKGPQNPVETVSWDDATAFCKQLNAQLQAQAVAVRLPTEAEWEFACRAGTKSRFYSGDSDSDLDSVAWYCNDITLRFGFAVGQRHGNGTHHPVGGKKSNWFGLYDMHGNVFQWCLDAYRKDYQKLSLTDPINNTRGDDYIIRGGYWNAIPELCRSAYRSRNLPNHRATSVGFRVVLSAPPSKTSQ
jgi:formylglycine-generating enzyme required for sulfatase activity